jgi:hypothetical protein
VTFNSTDATTVGTYAVTVTGTSGSLSETAVISVAVAALPPSGFALSSSPSALTLIQGATTGNSSTITATPSNGFTGFVEFTCAVTGPAGAISPLTCAFNPPQVNITNSIAVSSQLTFMTTATTTPDDYSVSVTGTSGGITETAPAISVTVTQAPPASFAVTGPSSEIIVSSPGQSATGTITVTPSGGFTGNVALTATVASRPAGADILPRLTFGSTSPVDITTSGAGAATLTITTIPSSISALDLPTRPGTQWCAISGSTLAFILLCGIPAWRRRWRGVLEMMLLLIALSVGLASCGPKTNMGATTNQGTTVGAYTITVTGTSGAITTQCTVALTVE